MVCSGIPKLHNALKNGSKRYAKIT